MSESHDDFYLRYYVGHKGKFGHEFLEFEFRPDGKLRYANNSNYKKDTLIRKEVYVNRAVLEELKRVVNESDIMKEDDALWFVRCWIDFRFSNFLNVVFQAATRSNWTTRIGNRSWR